MEDQNKTREQLISENEELRRRVAELEGIDLAHKSAEDALRESEARYRALAESTKDIIFILDRQGTLLYANQAAAQCIRIPAGDIVGKRQVDLFPPEMARSQIEKIARVFASGEVIEYDDLFHFGPAEVWLRIHLIPLRDEAGHIASVMGVCHNITERKRGEAALQEAHDELERRVAERAAELIKANEELAMFRKFAEASGQGFSMADLGGHVTYLNPALCRMLGENRPEDCIGRHISVYYSEEINRRGKQEIEPALMRAGHWEGELPMLSCQGNSIPTWQNSFLIRDESGNPIRLAVVITDMTERKQAEDAPRTSEEKYRTLVATSPDAVMMADLEGHLTLASQRAVELYGAENVEELLGRNPIEFFAPEDHPRLLANLRRTFDKGVTRDIEYTFLRKDGSRFSGEASAAAIRDASGRPTGFVAIVRDITERRRAQAALERERRTLKHMLEASDHERCLISYDIHDGLAQELAGAIMHFQIYAHARQTNSPDAAKAFDSAMAMLQQSHVEARRLISGVRPPILDESGVVAAIAHLVYDPAFEQGPKIDLRNRVTFKRLAPILENVIYRIVQEGLTNARNHSQSKTILVSLKQRGDRLRIEIRDRGVGFDPQAVKEDHFGLKGIRERARLLGGKCQIKSKPGVGTSIVVELPVVEREP